MRAHATAHPRLFLVACCLALWLPGFFTLPPGDRDESRFAQATKQMNETGDYVEIFNGAVPRNKKPIGIYWLQAPFAALAGPDLANPIWPYRIPSLLGGLLAVLATYQAGLWLCLRPGRAWLAAGMLAGCVALAAETHIAKTDAALLAATAWAACVLARAWLGARISAPWAAAFWLSLAAGILLKGPITPMVLGLTAGTLCLWERRARWLAALRPGWGVPLLLASVAPWFVAIGLATHGRFVTEAVGGDLGQKLAGGREAHGAPPGLHLLLLPLLAFPATLPGICGLHSAWAGRRSDPAARFLIAWALPAWLVFEAVPTKLPHYTLPLYPALFLLAARGVGQPAPGWVRVAGYAGLLAAGAVLAIASAGLPAALGAAWWLGLPSLAAVVLVAYLAARRRLAWALAACIPLYAAILGWELPRLDALWLGPRVIAALRRDWPQINPQGRGLALAGYAEPSLVFLSGTQTLLLPNGVQAARALQAGTASIALVSDREAARFDTEAVRLGLQPRCLDRIGGYNYSRGRWVVLSVCVK